MSEYRVSKLKSGKAEIIEFKKFDKKEDSEHYAKNQSVSDAEHSYEIQKNNQGNFTTIKAYHKGQQIQ